MLSYDQVNGPQAQGLQFCDCEDAEEKTTCMQCPYYVRATEMDETWNPNPNRTAIFAIKGDVLHSAPPGKACLRVSISEFRACLDSGSVREVFALSEVRREHLRALKDDREWRRYWKNSTNKRGYKRGRSAGSSANKRRKKRAR